ncbi:PAS domain-containing protein [Actinoplanes palleronii]|nr:PAS domain-containing protein [Actinoplanes palleronii]
MRATRIRPTGVERAFGDHEMIVTKTDTRGVITYVNDVFVRVSALPECDAVGQPHSVIRHPDMPRAVFKLLWDTLGEQREIFAYVQNLATDGAHYWVLAHVTPSYDLGGRVVGYHSNRRHPTPGAVTAVSALYTKIRAAESRESHTPDAVTAGYRALQDALNEHGMAYDELVWSLTNGSGR